MYKVNVCIYLRNFVALILINSHVIKYHLNLIPSHKKTLLNFINQNDTIYRYQLSRILKKKCESLHIRYFSLKSALQLFKLKYLLNIINNYNY